MCERTPIIEIDVSSAHNERELHELLKNKLGFPDFYGKNWAAFWDAITGLVEMPETLVLLGWRDLKRRMPRDAKIMSTLLKRLSQKYPNWSCIVEYK